MSSEKGPVCRQAGQTLIELVIAVAVIVIVVGALVFATISSIRNAQSAKNQTLATKYAQEGLERVRVGRDRNKSISNLDSVTSWNGSSSILCAGSSDIKSDSSWCDPITGISVLIATIPYRLLRNVFLMWILTES